MFVNFKDFLDVGKALVISGSLTDAEIIRKFCSISNDEDDRNNGDRNGYFKRSRKGY